LRPIGARELQLLIDQIWLQKRGWETMPMEEHFATFLRGRFGSDALVAEWSYNIIHALEQVCHFNAIL